MDVKSWNSNATVVLSQDTCVEGSLMWQEEASRCYQVQTERSLLAGGDVRKGSKHVRISHDGLIQTGMVQILICSDADIRPQVHPEVAWAPSCGALEDEMPSTRAMALNSEDVALTLPVQMSITRCSESPICEAIAA